MRHLHLPAAALVLLADVGCTFVTSCPPGATGGTANSSGGNQASGGDQTGQGGSAGNTAGGDAGAVGSMGGSDVGAAGSGEGGAGAGAASGGDGGSASDGAGGSKSASAGGTGGGSGGQGTGGEPSPSGKWLNVTANLAGLASECGNMTSVFAKPDEDLLIAGVALKGLWASRDGGGSWEALGAGKGSDVITNRPTALIYDPLDAHRFWESGIYGGLGIFETKDDGSTFHVVGALTHVDLVSIDFTDPARQTMLAGAHEQSRALHRSVNGGADWTNVGAGLPDGTNCSFPLVIDSMVHLVGCGGYGGGASGIYRTTNGGRDWSQVSKAGGIGAPLRASDGAIYWASPSDRGITRSDNDGASFSEARAAGSVGIVSPVELPDGRIATLGSGAVMLSADRGVTWRKASVPLPYSDASGVAYSAAQKAFFIWHFTCGFDGPVPVPKDAIMRYDFDYEKL